MKHNEKEIRLQDLVEGFLFSLQAEGRAPRTHEYYAKLLRHLLVFSRDQCWPSYINQLEPKHFRQFLSWVSSRSYEYNPGNGSHRFVKSKPSTAWPYYKAVRRLLNWGIEEGLLQQNPAKDIHFKAPPPPPIQPYNLGELKRFLAVCELDIKTGEVIIQNEDLIPNAARNDFEHNSTRQAFIQALPKFIKRLSDWADRIQKEDKAREVLAEVLTRLRAINQELPSIRRDKEMLLSRNNWLYYTASQIKPHVSTLRSIEAKDYEEAVTLLKECQDFVKSALTEKRKEQEKMEQQVVRSIQREASPVTESERERAEDIPKEILDLLEIYGIQMSTEMSGFLKLLDENYLKVTLSDEEYGEMMDSLRDYLEEQT